MKRTVGQLINADEDAWPTVLEWIAQAMRPVETLSTGASLGEATLFALQVTTRSPMGAIALRSGGILVDHGWLRILGAGNERIGGGLREWNGLDGREPLDPPLAGGFVVAYDAIGGFFALNGGAWEGDPGRVHYFPPDTYERESLDMTYSAFLEFAFSDALDRFYADLRWPGWESEVGAIGPDQAISIYPFLGFKGEPIAMRSRRPVPARELWGLYRSLGDQLHGLPDGATVRVRAEGEDSDAE